MSFSTRVNDIFVELADVQQLIATPVGDQVKEGMVRGVCGKIGNLGTLGARDAVQLYKLVRTFPDATKAAFEAAVDARLALDLDFEDVPEPKTQQLLTTPLAYCTDDDWLAINDPSATPPKIISVLVARIASLGIRSLHEQTVKFAVMIVLHKVKQNTGAWPPASVVFSWVNEFKSSFKWLKTPWEHETIKKYPMDPSSLPAHISRQHMQRQMAKSKAQSSSTCRATTPSVSAFRCARTRHCSCMRRRCTTKRTKAHLPYPPPPSHKDNKMRAKRLSQ